jgi:hypothetical protein
MNKKIIMALAIKCFFILSFVALLTNCATQRESTIVGGEYNASKDVTDYFVLPYGQVTLPGKWDKSGYNKIARQQFFTNQDSIIVAIAFGRTDKYEFNKDGALNGYDFVKAFYEWESEYFKSEGLESQMIENDSERHYVIYRIYGERLDTYFLIGEKNGKVSNFSINITARWNENEKIKFLKSLFLTD